MIFYFLVSIQTALIVIGVLWMLKKNDELPLLSALLLFYVASYRFFAVTNDLNVWVDFENFGFLPVNTERALKALAYIVLGEFFFVGSYMLLRPQPLPPMPIKADEPLFAWLRPRIILLGVLSLPLVYFARSSVYRQTEAGQSMGYEVSSYMVLLPLMLVGIATLILCLWRFGGLPTMASKISAAVILCGLAHLTFSSAGRFQFLGWVAAGGVVWSATYRPAKRLLLLGIVGAIGIIVFAVAGALRWQNEFAAQQYGMKKLAVYRAISAEDANMLDGFVLLQQVYPAMLPYGYGREHLEILLRPIPRRIWKNKPVGGYMNKLGLITANEGFTLGISPTLFGSFYGEGATAGIIIGSILYGFAFAGVMNFTRRMQPFGAAIVHACAVASLLPLLRGGDLPGIYAWIGMAFWPCFLVLFWKRKNLFATPTANEAGAAAAFEENASFIEVAAAFTEAKSDAAAKKTPKRAIGYFQSGKRE